MRIVRAGDDRIGADDFANDLAAGVAAGAAFAGHLTPPFLAIGGSRVFSRLGGKRLGKTPPAWGASWAQAIHWSKIPAPKSLRPALAVESWDRRAGILCGPRGVSAGWTWVGVTAGFSSAGRAS